MHQSVSVEEKTYTEGVVVGKPEGRLSLGRLRCRCDYNIKMAVKEIGWEVVNLRNLAKDRDKLWIRCVHGTETLPLVMRVSELVLKLLGDIYRRTYAHEFPSNI